MRFVVLGGGCYGTFYAKQLLRAREAEVLGVSEVVVVDREKAPRALRELSASPALRFEVADWHDYLEAYLGRLPSDADDWLVTPPFTPHLALAWLLDRLRAIRPKRDWVLEPFRRFPGTPFECQAEQGPLVVSHADWTCPVHCIEPATCPATRGPRFWDLDRTVRHLAVALDDGGQPVDQLHLFHCHHIAFGVGAYRAGAVIEAFDAIIAHVDAAAATASSRFLVGTISHCHGALHLLVSRPGTLPEAPPVQHPTVDPP
jgi:hypothetical protein